tara:strand:+ start:147 stop:773 length:627 start_codon:yes stop_codon:yes gene_type:complete
MKISYAVTVCNEFEEIQRLIPFLLENKRHQDEIVVLFDQKNGSSEVLDYLLKFNKLPNVQTWRGFEFENDFAQWKNLLTTYCAGDYVFQIDADEIPHKSLMANLPVLLETNNVEVLRVPRVNTVDGLTRAHVEKWRWVVDDSGRVNWPDPQWRVYKRTSEIKWKNKVHEVLHGYKTYADLPYEEEWSLYHPKDIKKQEKQNNFYEDIQ